MGHKIRLIIPTDNKLEIAPIVGRICGRWGGCTISDARGHWTNNDGVMIEDRLSVLECSIGLWNPEAQEWWEDIADVVRKEWNQDCVFLSVQDEHAIFVYPSDNKEVIK